MTRSARSTPDTGSTADAGAAPAITPLASSAAAYRQQLLERRRKALYAFLLLTTVGMSLVYLLIMWTDINTDIPIDNLGRLHYASVAILVGAGATYLIARRGAIQMAAYLFLGMTVLVATFLDEPQQVISGRSAISFPVLIVAAGLILPPYATFVFAGASILAIFALAVLYTHDYVQVASNAIVFFITASITWFFTSRLERANAELARSQAALQRLNAELEEHVEQRTAELRQANAELAQSGRLKDEFLAAMSHELRTPLAEVIMVAEALKDGLFGPLSLQQKQMIQQVQAGGDRLFQLINRLLVYSQIVAGELQLKRRAVHVGALCQDAAESVAERANAKNQALRCHNELDNSASVEVDAEQFQTILVALLDNAVKFTPEGGSIGLDIRAGAEAGGVEFVVWDTGIGIAAEHLEGLIKPFHQVDGSLGRPYEGAGLSLAIVERLVVLHGGHLRITSTLGKGSCFTIVLPEADS